MGCQKSRCVSSMCYAGDSEGDDRVYPGCCEEPGGQPPTLCCRAAQPQPRGECGEPSLGLSHAPGQLDDEPLFLSWSPHEKGSQCVSTKSTLGLPWYPGGTVTAGRASWGGGTCPGSALTGLGVQLLWVLRRAMGTPCCVPESLGHPSLEKQGLRLGPVRHGPRGSQR